MNTSVSDHARLLIIGDDLSGTADCAVTCIHHGLRSVVSLGQQLAGLASGDVDVLAVDTDTRRHAPADAASANEQTWHVAADGRRLYKKIDSTLRGNVAAEVTALAAVAGMAVVAPAFPQAGRTTRNGQQYIFDIPVEASEVWRNEHIEGTANLCTMLAASGLRVAHVALETVRAGIAAVRSELAGYQAEHWQAVVCDSETDEDLNTVATASATLSDIFWVGSAGLAAPLVKVLAGSSSSPVLRDSVISQERSRSRGILAVVGSMSSISHQQVATLRSQANDAVDFFEANARAVLDPISAIPLALTATVTNALAQGRHVVVSLSQSERIPVADGALLARRLAERLAPAAEQAGGLIATGGETARALLSAMGIASLEVIEEIERGVPLLVAAHGGHTLPVVTKAGGFGQPETLYRAWQRLVAMQQADASAPRQSSEEEAMTYRPVIGITMGDAAGVGPEIIMKSLAHGSVYEQCRPVVIGDVSRLRDAGRRAGVDLVVRAIERPSDGEFKLGVVDCIDLNLIPEDLPYGKLSPVAGDAAYRYIARTVELTSSGELDAICTAPLNKEALHAGGHIFPGHTEMLAHLTGIEEVSMMLVAPNLRVIHVTTHIGLLDAIRKIEPGLVQRTIERAHETLVRAGIANPRIGVCGINPHAGENGLFGYGEEEEKIVPAVQLLQERGWNVEGPLPADTLFFRAGRGDFDVVVAMYHDQGHGPVKVMGLEAGVNVTVGLPVIRTSVDHGTAFDIAGKGIADERSMLEAFRQAVDLATRRNETAPAATVA